VLDGSRRRDGGQAAPPMGGRRADADLAAVATDAVGKDQETTPFPATMAKPKPPFRNPSMEPQLLAIQPVT
jgi:hypothetical protein